MESRFQARFRFDTDLGGLLVSLGAPDVARVPGERLDDLKHQPIDQGRAVTARVAAIGGLLVAGILAWLLLSGGDDADYKVTAAFENASQLVPGNEVTIGGSRVGLVDEIELGDNGEALVTFSRRRGLRPAAPRHHRRRSAPSALGSRQPPDRSCTLPPEGTATEEIPDGGTMDASETVSEVDLDEIFNTLDTETVADLKKVIRGFESLLRGSRDPGQRGLPLPEPLPLHLPPALRRADPRRARARAADRRRRPALRSARRAPRRHPRPGRQPEPDDGRDRPAKDRPGLLDQTAAPVHAPASTRPRSTCASPSTTSTRSSTPQSRSPKSSSPSSPTSATAAANLVPTVRDLDKIILDPGTDNDLVDLTRLQTRPRRDRGRPGDPKRRRAARAPSPKRPSALTTASTSSPSSAPTRPS